MAADYGSTDGVGALQTRYSNTSSDFDTTTTPTAARVTIWLTQISNALNVQLTARGYSTPITEADLNGTLDMFTNDMTATLVDASYGSGRYAPNSKAILAGGGLYAVLNNDIADFLDGILVGNPVLAGSSATTRTDGWSE